MKHISMTQIVPKLRKLLYWVMPKLLDFSDYRNTISRTHALEVQVTELQQRIRYRDEIDLYYSQLLSIIEPLKTDLNLLRIGSKFDGGYHVPNGFEKNMDWITIGLGYNTEFENELLSRGCAVNSFDHTVNSRPKKLSKGVKWHDMGWGIPKKQSKLRSLNDIKSISALSPKSPWCLKFDIEGSEWEVIGEVNTIIDWPQIICCELHNLRWENDSKKNYLKLQKLETLFTIYKCVYINGNNFSANMVSKFVDLHDIVEFTLVREELFVKMARKTFSKQKEFESANNPNSINRPKTITRRVVET